MTATPAVALEACLAQIEEYLEAREDVVDGDYGQPAPNEEMILLRELREARPALLAALRLREWIPVSERLPERWGHVDVWPDPRDDTHSYYAPADGGTNGVKAGRWYHNDRDGYDTEIRVTHWRESPAPPTADDLARGLEEG